MGSERFVLAEYNMWSYAGCWSCPLFFSFLFIHHEGSEMMVVYGMYHASSGSGGVGGGLPWVVVQTRPSQV